MVNSRLEKNKKQRFDIAKKEHIENTVNVTKLVLKISLITVFVIGLFFVIIRYIGTSGLIVKEYSLEYVNLPENFYGLKIVHISDINYNKNTVDIKRIKKVVKKVNSIEPDLIIFTGDLIHGDIENNEVISLEKELNKLEANLGKYAVFGEDDDISRIIIKNAGFIDISNQYDLIYKDKYSPILITGFSSKNINVTNAFSYFKDENANQNIFTIALMHKPDTIDEVLSYHSVDLALAGHSLNGLIKLPKVGGIFTFDGSKKYFDSYYKIDDTDLYISGGIGTRDYPFRLFNHPSINLYRLKWHVCVFFLY